VHVSYGGIEGLLCEDVVATRANLGSQATVQDQLAGDFSQDGGAEGHVGQLECISEDVEVASSKNEGDDGNVGNGGGACITSKSTSNASYSW